MDAIEQLLADEGEEAVKRRLPERLQYIAGLIGVRSAYALARRYGGVRITFTGRGACHAEMNDLIGTENVSTLNKFFGGEEVPIPRAFQLIRFLKHRDLLHRWRNGESVRELALRFQLTERQVFYIAAAARDS